MTELQTNALETTLLEQARHACRSVADRFGLEMDDLLSEFYATAYQRFDSGHIELGDPGRLVAILRNCAIDMLRREPHHRLRRTVVSRRSRQHCEVTHDCNMPRFVPLLEASEAELDRLQDDGFEHDGVGHVALREILDQIPPAGRQVIWLRFGCEMSWAEVAEAVGKETEQVKSMFKRLKPNLRLLFREKLS